MNGITELALLLKARENGAVYSPMLGTVIELPDLKIRLSEKVILNKSHIKACVDLYAKDEAGRYINLNREAALLPYADGQKFLLMGLVI